MGKHKRQFRTRVTWLIANMWTYLCWGGGGGGWWGGGGEGLMGGGDLSSVWFGLVCWSLTSLCHSNGHIGTMPAEKLIPLPCLLPWPGFDPSFSGYNDEQSWVSGQYYASYRSAIGAGCLCWGGGGGVRMGGGGGENMSKLAWGGGGEYNQDKQNNLPSGDTHYTRCDKTYSRILSLGDIWIYSIKHHIFAVQGGHKKKYIDTAKTELSLYSGRYS